VPDVVITLSDAAQSCCTMQFGRDDIWGTRAGEAGVSKHQGVLLHEVEHLLGLKLLLR
jgi:hypothetical protein